MAFRGKKEGENRRKYWYPTFSPFLTDLLIVLCIMPFSTVFGLYCGGQCTFPCFPGVLLTSTLHNILSKPLAAFPHIHCRDVTDLAMGLGPFLTVFSNYH